MCIRDRNEEEEGLLSLQFEPLTIQSCMRKSDPHQLVVDYTQTMMGFLLFQPGPNHIAMIGVVQKVRFLGNTGTNVPRQIEGDNSVETAETGMGGTPSHDALRRERSAGNRGAQASGGAFPRSSILWDSCRFVRRSGCA